MFKVRRIATPDDIAEEDIKLLNRLEIRTLGVESLCDKKGSYWWYAYCDDEIAGFAGLLHYPELDCSFLYRAGVLKYFRGNGLQRRMIGVREKQAKRDGYSRIVSYTSYDNIHSANNLIKCGYKLYKPKWDWGVENALYFEKEL